MQCCHIANYMQHFREFDNARMAPYCYLQDSQLLRMLHLQNSYVKIVVSNEWILALSMTHFDFGRWHGMRENKGCLRFKLHHCDGQCKHKRRRDLRSAEK